TAQEEERKDSVPGTLRGARGLLTASRAISAVLEQERERLPMLFIVTDLTVNLGPATGADEVGVVVGKARGVKCGRCWRFDPSVRSEPDWSGICDRCVDALAEPVNS